ncbi:MAG: hypothetical protein H7836_01765 [Magnetococcus sp. YQC-3]
MPAHDTPACCSGHCAAETRALCRPEVEKILLPLEQDEKTVVVLVSSGEPLLRFKG